VLIVQQYSAGVGGDQQFAVIPAHGPDLVGEVTAVLFVDQVLGEFLGLPVKIQQSAAACARPNAVFFGHNRTDGAIHIVFSVSGVVIFKMLGNAVVIID